MPASNTSICVEVDIVAKEKVLESASKPKVVAIVEDEVPKTLQKSSPIDDTVKVDNDCDVSHVGHKKVAEGPSVTLAVETVQVVKASLQYTKDHKTNIVGQSDKEIGSSANPTIDSEDKHLV